jgi:hypothetical protein
MVRVASIFSQILEAFPRIEFARLTHLLGMERNAKGFTTWSQFVAMLYCHLGRANSLREIDLGLRSASGKLGHLGIKPIPRSTLSYANNHRRAEFFKQLFFATLHNFQNRHMFGRPKRFRFKNPLHSLDSTTISLCLEIFPWAKYKYGKGGIKAHFLLEHQSYLPAFVRLSLAVEPDVHTAKFLRLLPGSIITMDKAYNNYLLFARWTDEGVYFVTRQKEDAVYTVIEVRVPKGKNIIADEIIRLTGANAQNKCPHDLRRVVVYDPEKDREIVLLTNHLDFAASTISAIYKERWKIELFFKTLKQNLHVKNFIGTSPNALEIQIWTALIALLILRWLHYLSQATWALSNIAHALSVNLFTYRPLLEWLRNPAETPPIEPEPVQLRLPNLKLDSRSY